MPGKDSSTGRRPADWLAPSLADLLVAALAVRPYFLGDGWSTLLSDANTGLHILTGGMILSSGRAPATEPFSFTLPGKPWFAWEWLTETGSALLHGWGGLGAVAIFAAALIAAWTALVFRNSLSSGRQWLLAAVLAMAASQAAANHMLARPHLITWVLLALSVAVCQHDRLEPDRRIWVLVPVCLLWANLHGGFLTLPVYLALIAAGYATEWLWKPGERARAGAAALRYGSIAAAALAVTLANPYGLRLHAHIFEYMRAGWLKEMVQEYHAPSPKLGEPFYWFCALAALAAAASLNQLRRREVAGALPALFFAWAAMQSARHIPVFLTVALPVIAAESARWLEALARRGGPRSAAAAWVKMDGQMLPHAQRFSVWIPLFLAAALAFPARFGAPADFPGRHFPVSLLQAHQAGIARPRLLTTDAWADYVLFHTWPRTRVFVDGMNDFFGPAIGDDYLEMLQAGPRTAALMERWQFDAVLIPQREPLVRWLRGRPGWRLAAEDPQAALFVRTNP
jgi:hypothetical protein